MLLASPNQPSLLTRMLSTISLVKKVSPVLVMSDQGVPGAVAAGNGRPSVLARSTIASVIPPPVDVPKIAIFFGSFDLTTSFHTAIASSIAAGYGKSGGMR